ncbi:MAG: hypothetical protein IJ309_00065 [Clostridia bacterium]|nr:hypothetical protein [Clostridia bacterium]
MKRYLLFALALVSALMLMLASCNLLSTTGKPTPPVNTSSGSNVSTGSGEIQDPPLDVDPEVCTHPNIVFDRAVAATCTSEGLTSGSHCGVCGTVISAQESLPMEEHVEVKGKDIAPTCSSVGYEGGSSCFICGTQIEAPITLSPLPHTETIIKGYASTCSENGLSDGKYCSTCDSITVEQVPLDKTSHNEVITPAVAPTCQSKGATEKRQCSVCHEVTLESVELPVGDHTVVTDKALAPTCSDTGLTEGSHCSVCNKVFVAQTTVAKSSDHVYPEFATVTKSPTTSSSGTGTLACTRCGYIQSLTFEKLTTNTLTKDDIYSIETNIYNPAYDNRYKVIDGSTNVGSIYGAGNDWFGNVGDVLTITLKQEMVLTTLQLYTAGNYTSAKVTVKDSAGNATATKSYITDAYTNGGAGKVQTIVSGKQITAYTIEIEITGLKWNDARTHKISEVVITAAPQDTRIAHTHAFRDYIEETRVATCQLSGLSLYKCFCGYEKEIETGIGDHNYSTLKSVLNVSCGENGKSVYECDCGLTTTVETEAKGHIFYKLVECSIQPTYSSYGRASYKCINCSLTDQVTLDPLPLEDIKYLRVDKIENGKVYLLLNIYGERASYEVRYSQSPITEENYNDATIINAIVDGENLVTLQISLGASLTSGYYVAVKPYHGENYGKMASVRVGGDEEIPIDYDKAQVYHGEVLGSFKKMFDGDTTTKLGLFFPNSGTTAELYGSNLRPIVDLQLMHFVTKVSVYFDEDVQEVTVRWSDTPLDFMSENSLWDGYRTFSSVIGWNDVTVYANARYIQIIYVDGHGPCEVKAYGYQSGDGDEIATSIGSLPTVGDLMGMCGFVAAGGGHTPIDEVSCTTVLREYHNFGWSYDASKYGGQASFFNNERWMGYFDYEYRVYKEAGIKVIPCIQWSLGNQINGLGETISYKVGEDNLPVYDTDGNLIRASFWERFDPNTYFVYADCFFAFAARYGNNGTTELYNIAQNYVQGEPTVGQGTIEWMEMGNEPEGGWNGIHNYLSAYQLAAATSAAYDGHCSTMVTPSTKGYHLGGKNADSTIKLAMAGVSGVSNEYITALCYWMKANRQDGKTAFDAFNVHHYMTKTITLPNGSSASVGISPEEAQIDKVLSQLVEIRDKYYPEKEVWITEFGWDTNQSYATATSAHAYGEYTGRQVQAMWLTRTYLILSATGVDKADMYMCHGGNDETSVGKYGTCGVIGIEIDENGNEVKVKKDSYYYLYTLKNTLGAYTFDSKVEAYDDNVMIYKYKTAEGKTAYAVWCKTSDGTKVEGYQLGIDAEGATLVENVYGDIDGVHSTLTADSLGYVTVNVSENPIYILVD